jgi:hypothetical protein
MKEECREKVEEGEDNVSAESREALMALHVSFLRHLY